MARTISPVIIAVLGDVFSAYAVYRKPGGNNPFKLEEALSELLHTGHTALFCYFTGKHGLTLNVFPDVIGAGGAWLSAFEDTASSRLTCINRLPLQGFPHRTYKPYTPIYTSLVGRLAVYDIDASTDEPPLAVYSIHETDVDAVLRSFLKSHGDCLTVQYKVVKGKRITVCHAVYLDSNGPFAVTWSVDGEELYKSKTYKFSEVE